MKTNHKNKIFFRIHIKQSVVKIRKKKNPLLSLLVSTTRVKPAKYTIPCILYMSYCIHSHIVPQ